MSSEPLDASFPKRRRPADGVFKPYGEPIIVFLTVCTRHRSPWLADTTVHEGLKSVWLDAQAWLVGRYILMPDHLHLFCAPGVQDISIETWITYWKRLLAQKLNNPNFRWQSRQWDTRLRRHENYTEKWEYVEQNPVRAGLATHPEQ